MLETLLQCRNLESKEMYVYFLSSPLPLFSAPPHHLMEVLPNEASPRGGGGGGREGISLPPPCTHSMFVLRSYIGHANCLEHAFVRTRTSERTSSLPSLLLPSLPPRIQDFFSFFSPSLFLLFPPTVMYRLRHQLHNYEGGGGDPGTVGRTSGAGGRGERGKKMIKPGSKKQG